MLSSNDLPTYTAKDMQFLKQREAFIASTLEALDRVASDLDSEQSFITRQDLIDYTRTPVELEFLQKLVRLHNLAYYDRIKGF